MVKNWKEYAADFAVTTGASIVSGVVSGVVVGVAVSVITSNPAFGILAAKVTAGAVGGGSIAS